jgi:hypothetical protein
MEVADKRFQLVIYAGLLQWSTNSILLDSRVFYGK